MTFKVKTYRGWKIKKTNRGLAKGLLYAQKGKTSFGILFSGNTTEELKKEIDKREDKK